MQQPPLTDMESTLDRHQQIGMAKTLRTHPKPQRRRSHHPKTVTPAAVITNTDASQTDTVCIREKAKTLLCLATTSKSNSKTVAN